MAGVGWISTTVADLRRDPADNAERVSQLPMFTKVTVLATQGSWTKVQGPDLYVGWAKLAQVQIGEMDDPAWKIRLPWVPVRRKGGRKLLGFLVLDVAFPGKRRGRQIILPWPTGETGVIPRDAVYPITWKGTVSDLSRLAQNLLGVPYLWGGTTTFGFDCSGFVQRLFHFVYNFWLPRDSQAQRQAGKIIRKFSAAKKGDLVFFPGHVAVYLEKGKIVHASGRLGRVAVTDLTASDPYAQELWKALSLVVRVV